MPNCEETMSTVDNRYPKRLIEVDLPIRRISEQARREKSIRHGHICTLHIWWARRPLAACRAVILAALWPDPADPLCPPVFRQAAADRMRTWRDKHGGKTRNWQDGLHLRAALLDFIAEFANWDNSTNQDYLETSRALVQIAHESLGGMPGTHPLIVDPFAGGGSIPLEALRVGADVFASDLNPVPVLLNKVVLEYIPKYGQRLADEVHKWGDWVKIEAEQALAEFYPKDEDGATPLAYLWARTIQCEGPGCGADVPLMRSLWLAKKPNHSVALQILPNARTKCVEFQIIAKQRDGWIDQANANTQITHPKFDGTVRRSSTTCPCCGYTTSAENTRQQFIRRSGGANDARLVAVAIKKSGDPAVGFRLGTDRDIQRFRAASERLVAMERANVSPVTLVPNEPLPYLRSIFNINLLGVDTWGKLFNSRQALALVTIVEKTRLAAKLMAEGGDEEFALAVATCLAFAVDRCADYWSSLAVWAGDFVAHTFGRQALGIIWDYAEVNGFADGSGNYSGAIEWIARVIERLKSETVTFATVECTSACQHPLPNDSAQAFFTDPPYYDAVPYADLADFFYVWLKRSIGQHYPGLFGGLGTPKDGEIVQLSERNPIYANKTREYFEALMKEAMTEGRRVLEPAGVGVVVFAHKTTTGWEAQLQAMVDAGWVVTASWPIDTERPGRLRANNAAALASSVHLVCRPRENRDGSLRTGDVGDWRDVLDELPRRLHEWMPRLAREGVVGADAIFACLGPALEVFSRYSCVEKASGEQVGLKAYLEHVWAAVAREALSVIFSDADATDLEPDARLTVMWLWTLSAPPDVGTAEDLEDNTSGLDDEDPGDKSAGTVGIFSLEYDTARKIAQGLGANLDVLGHVVEVKGETARLLRAGERARYLLGKDSGRTPKAKREKAGAKQLTLFEVMTQIDEGTPWGSELGVPPPGATVLDRVHQAMILFGGGRGEALKRFLVEEGAGSDARLWKLAQSLSALYPPGTDEKRWVDGLLARKKGLGF